MRRIIILLSVILPIAPALAGTVITLGGSGRDCYLETLLDSTTPLRNQQSLATCNRAVDDAAANSTDTYGYAVALVNRADIRLRLEDYTGVVADADRAIGLDSDLGAAHLNRGAGLVGLKQYQDALTELDRAIALNPNRLELAYFDRALAKESLGDLLGAYHDYLMAVQINPKFQRATDELSRFKVTNSNS